MLKGIVHNFVDNYVDNFSTDINRIDAMRLKIATICRVSLSTALITCGRQEL